MNIALEDCKEYVKGKMLRNYGDAFVRGNNGMSGDLIAAFVPFPYPNDAPVVWTRAAVGGET